MKFDSLPVGQIFTMPYGTFRKLENSWKGAGRAEVITHANGLPVGQIVVFTRTKKVG